MFICRGRGSVTAVRMAQVACCLRNSGRARLSVCGLALGRPGPDSIHQGRNSGDEILYRAFFFDVVKTEQTADKLEAMGLSGAKMRARFQGMAALTAQEAAALKAIATDSETAVRAQNQQITQVATALHAQYCCGPLPPAQRQQIQQAFLARNQIVLDHVQSLRSALGAGRFQSLDQFVRRYVTPHLTLAPPGSQPPPNGQKSVTIRRAK